MFGKNNYICIAGKNKCAIDAIDYVKKRYNKKYNILALPNKSDKGLDSWQKSFRKHCKKKNIKIVNIKNLHGLKNLYFFSLEFETIIKPETFKSSNLYNFHFSLLPKYRGCHTNFYQIYNGEKYSGVTLHKINNGIDTGDIIDKKKFKIKINDTAYDNYFKLMRTSSILFKKNIFNILNSNYKFKKQNLLKGSYFSRDSINYKKILRINMKKPSLKLHNRIRSLIFPPYQIPVVNGVKVKKSVYRNNKIYLIESFNNKFKNR